MTDLVIVVPCTSSKTLPPTVRIGGRRDLAVESWIAERDEAAKGPTRLAGDLYKGVSWTASRRLADERPGSELLVASAGLGLVPRDVKAPGYDATFAAGSDADVAHGLTGDARSKALRTWWQGLCQSRGTSLTRVVQDRSSAKLMVVASGSYLDAMHADLVDAIGAAPGRVIIVGTDAPSHPELAAAAVEFDHLVLRRSWSTDAADPRPTLPQERFDDLLRGNHATLAQMVARHILATVEGAPTVAAAQQSVDSLADGLHEKYETWSRRPFDDDSQLEAWIAANADEGSSYTALLRHLRSTGRACEQKRFRAAYRRVTDVAPPTTGQQALPDIEDAA